MTTQSSLEVVHGKGNNQKYKLVSSMLIASNQVFFRDEKTMVKSNEVGHDQKSMTISKI